MTQTAVRKIIYPKGRMIVVRDCTVAICLNNNPGATLLSTFLFWYEHPHQFDTYQGDTFTVCRTQARIEEQACNQIDAKTIHDTAVPLLMLLGYLTVKEKMNGNLYTLHMDRITTAYAAYEQGEKELKNFLTSSLQLESAPIRIPDDELEKVLINKRQLYLQLERVLIAIGADSHCKRGRKPKSKAAQEAISENDRLLEKEENSNRELSSPSPNEQNTDALLVATLPLRDDEGSDLQSSYSHEPSESEWLCEGKGEVNIFEEDSDPTEKRPAVKPPDLGQPPASPGRAAAVREHHTAQSTRDAPLRQPTEKPTKQPPSEKTDGKSNGKKDAPLLCEPRIVRALLDANRGYALVHVGAIINQNKVLKEWCRYFCLKDYHSTLNHLKTCRCKNPSHEWWHKDEHWRYLDADNLAKLTPSVLAELGMTEKPQPPPGVPVPGVRQGRSAAYAPVLSARPR